jgi:hypothetical protein
MPIPRNSQAQSKAKLRGAGRASRYKYNYKHYNKSFSALRATAYFAAKWSRDGALVSATCYVNVPSIDKI